MMLNLACLRPPPTRSQANFIGHFILTEHLSEKMTARRVGEVLGLAVGLDSQHGALVQLREPHRYDFGNRLVPHWNRVEEFD